MNWQYHDKPEWIKVFDAYSGNYYLEVWENQLSVPCYNWEVSKEIDDDFFNDTMLRKVAYGKTWSSLEAKEQAEQAMVADQQC